MIEKGDTAKAGALLDPELICEAVDRACTAAEVLYSAYPISRLCRDLWKILKNLSANNLTTT